MYNTLNSFKQANPFVLIFDDSLLQEILPMNQWVLIYPYQTLNSTQILTPSLPWFKITTELLEVALTCHMKQGIHININLGLLYHTLNFLKKSKQSKKEEQGHQIAQHFPDGAYIFSSKKGYHVITTL